MLGYNNSDIVDKCVIFLKYSILKIYILVIQFILWMGNTHKCSKNIRFITCEKEIEFYKCQDTLKNHTSL